MTCIYSIFRGTIFVSTANLISFSYMYLFNTWQKRVQQNLILICVVKPSPSFDKVTPKACKSQTWSFCHEKYLVIINVEKPYTKIYIAQFPVQILITSFIQYYDGKRQTLAWFLYLVCKDWSLSSLLSNAQKYLFRHTRFFLNTKTILSCVRAQICQLTQDDVTKLAEEEFCLKMNIDACILTVFIKSIGKKHMKDI